LELLSEQSQAVDELCQPTAPLREVDKRLDTRMLSIQNKVALATKNFLIIFWDFL